MNKLKKALVILTFLGFFLPFLPPNCAGLKKTERATEVSDNTIDTNIVQSVHVLDTTSLKSDSTILSDTDTSKFDLVSLYCYKVFISPDDENLSGFGYLYIGFENQYFYIFFSFLILWLLGLKLFLKIKVIAFEDYKLLILGLFLLILLGISKYSTLQFGFWITIGLYLLTTLLFLIERTNYFHFGNTSKKT